MNNEENWEDLLENDEDYDINLFLSYRGLPISKKLEYLEETTDLFNRLTPKKNKLAWEKLKEMGF